MVKVIGLAVKQKFEAKNFSRILDESEADVVSKVLIRNNFKAETGDFAEVETGAGKVVVMGLGNKIDRLSLRKCGQQLAAKLFNDENALVHVYGLKNINASEMAHQLAFGLETGSYYFDKYTTRKKAEEYPALEQVCFIAEEGDISLGDFADYAALANGIRYAKDLGNEPANYLTPEVFALDIKRLEYLGLEVEILDRKAMEENEFKLALAVAKGSCHEPKTAVIRWVGNPEKDYFDVVLAGKGVTYDSGGINLKSRLNLLNMKFDMCGAAAVVAAMKTIALQKQPVNAAAVLVLVENMPGGNAFKPDDVLSSMSGQTVEIIDTDGEGRLVLADALWYIQENFETRAIVDIATLTGTVDYALAGQYAGLFSNDEKLAKTLCKAGEFTGEKLWQLPMEGDFDKWIDSKVADMKNVGRKEGDGSQAACFLKRYIKDGMKWAHLDIAGCELDKDNMATGFGVKLLNNYMRNLV